MKEDVLKQKTPNVQHPTPNGGCRGQRPRLQRRRLPEGWLQIFFLLRLFAGATIENLSRLNHCYRPEEVINSAKTEIEMTAEQILKEIEALPKSERERLVQRMREATDIPQDFADALDDFAKQRFVSMETALNETPPDA